MEIRCYGCGAIIQNEDRKKIGYVPKNNIDEEVLCQRCFKLRHYHELSEAHLSKDDYFKILQTIGEKDCLVIYIIDLFDFEASLIPGLNRHIGGNDLFVLANKRDLLPSSLNNNRLEQWVRRQLKKEGIKPIDVVITSGIKNLNLDEIYENLQTYRKGRDVYVVGVTNVGKSTFINALLKHYASIEDKYLITVSEFPGTTLNLINIPLDEDSQLYDSPGIINEESIIQKVDPKDLKNIIPRSEIRPITYQLEANQSLYLSGLARLDYLEGKKQGFTIYVSKNIKMHRCKRENADRLYNNHKTLEMSLYDTIDDMKTYEFSIKERCDLYIGGLGFIKVNGKGGRIRILAPKGVMVIKRESLI